MSSAQQSRGHSDYKTGQCHQVPGESQKKVLILALNELQVNGTHKIRNNETITDKPSIKALATLLVNGRKNGSCMLSQRITLNKGGFALEKRGILQALA